MYFPLLLLLLLQFAVSKMPELVLCRDEKEVERKDSLPGIHTDAASSPEDKIKEEHFID